MEAEIELKRNKACAPVRNSSLQIQKMYLLAKLIHRNHERRGGCISQTKFHLQAQRDITVAILIILLKNIRHSLQTNTCLDEQVETECIAAIAVICAVEQSDELLGKTVSKGDQGFVKFSI